MVGAGKSLRRLDSQQRRAGDRIARTASSRRRLCQRRASKRNTRRDKSDQLRNRVNNDISICVSGLHLSVRLPDHIEVSVFSWSLVLQLLHLPLKFVDSTKNRFESGVMNPRVRSMRRQLSLHLRDFAANIRLRFKSDLHFCNGNADLVDFFLQRNGPRNP